MKNADVHKEMLIQVAMGLGAELLPQFVFVGGCTTALLVTDEFTREQVRYTDDVDLIVHLAGYASYTQLISKLRSKGFSERPENDSPICAMWLNGLRVDVMPDDESILGFSNRWYKDAMSSAEYYSLSDQIRIKLITPSYFVATKLEAYLSRGNNDPLSSHDIEDLLNLYDGRTELLSELKQAPSELKYFISTQIINLLKNNNFEYAVQSCAVGDTLRGKLIFDRLEDTCEL